MSRRPLNQTRCPNRFWQKCYEADGGLVNRIQNLRTGQGREFSPLNQYFLLQNPASSNGLGEEFVAFVPALELVHLPRLWCWRVRTGDRRTRAAHEEREI
jgi:hypothetical protein